MSAVRRHPARRTATRPRLAQSSAVGEQREYYLFFNIASTVSLVIVQAVAE